VSAAGQPWACATLPALRCLKQTLRDNFIDGCVKGEPDVRARHLEIVFGISGSTISWIDNSVIERIDCSLHHGGRHFSTQRTKEIATAARGVALREHIRTLFLQNLLADRLGCTE